MRKVPLAFRLLFLEIQFVQKERLFSWRPLEFLQIHLLRRLLIQGSLVQLAPQIHLPQNLADARTQDPRLFDGVLILSYDIFFLSFLLFIFGPRKVRLEVLQLAGRRLFDLGEGVLLFDLEEALFFLHLKVGFSRHVLIEVFNLLLLLLLHQSLRYDFSAYVQTLLRARSLFLVLFQAQVNEVSQV